MSDQLPHDGKGWILHLTVARDVDGVADRVRDLIAPGDEPEHKMYECALSDPDETLVRIGWLSRLMDDSCLVE